MKYVGSKNRHAKEILGTIFKEIGNSGQIGYDNWVEPFVGGANMIDKVPKVFKSIIGIDINPYLIAMFQAVQKGWEPPVMIDEKMYKICKERSKVSYFETLETLAVIGFVGIGCSYSGKWYGGYERGNDKNGRPRNYAKESRDNLIKQSKNLNDITFICSDYQAIKMPNEPSIIYCDPPYQNTTKYNDIIEHDKFWNWCEHMMGNGHKVFVSEYNAPEGWRCIWQKVVNNTLTKETGCKQGTEKLFTK